MAQSKKVDCAEILLFFWLNYAVCEILAQSHNRCE